MDEILIDDLEIKSDAAVAHAVGRTKLNNYKRKL